MSRLCYKEGDVFAVPLRAGGFGLGMVARMPKAGKVLLGYFWGPARSAIPAPEDLPNLHPQDALLVRMFGDLSLIKGDWPVIKPINEWDRAQWPVPKFVRQSPLSKRAWLVTYDDGDPNQVVNEEPCDYGVTGYERDGLLGSEAIEILLTNLLKLT